MPRVEKPADSALFEAQLAGKGNVRNALLPHRRIESQLCCDDGCHGDQHLALCQRAGSGYVFMGLDVHAQGNSQAVVGHLQRLFQDHPPVLAPYTSGRSQCRLLFRLPSLLPRRGRCYKDRRSACLKLPSIDPQVLQHRDQGTRRELAMRDGSPVGSKSDFSVTALPAAGVEIKVQSVSTGISPGSPEKLSFVHMSISAHPDAIAKGDAKAICTTPRVRASWRSGCGRCARRPWPRRTCGSVRRAARSRTARTSSPRPGACPGRAAARATWSTRARRPRPR